MRRRLKIWLGFLAVGGALAVACGPSRPEPPDTSPIVFEVRHTGPDEKPQGFFITRAGFVHRVDFNGNSAPLTAKNPGRGDLLRYFGRILETRTQVPEATMRAIGTFIPGTAGGALVCDSSEPDPGQTDYSAWIVDAHGTYSRIWLARTGTAKCSNTAPDAHVLLAWLYKLVGSEHGAFNRASTGNLTIADDVRRNPDACVPNALPVELRDGTRYCSQHGGDCRDNTCECSGDRVCAGGESHCRVLQSGVLTCVE